MRWIGPADAEEPASFTRFAKSVPRQNAGGEGAAAPASGERDPAEPPAVDGGDSGLGVGLGSVALALAAVALVMTVRTGRVGRST